MLKWIKQLDRILRGQATSLAALREGTIDISARGLLVVLLILGMLYGLCMGLFSVIAPHGPERGTEYRQIIATTFKVPLLFFLTLLVTFPSLYVFNALVGSRLLIRSVLRLLVASLAVILAVLASFGTIVAFFSVSTTSYHFMLLLNVLVFAISGFLGLAFLLQTLHRLTIAQEEPSVPPTTSEPQRVQIITETTEPAPPTAFDQSSDVAPTATEPPPISILPRAVGALDRTDGRILGPNVKAIFRIWIIVFGLVGAQMGWVLRPFVGNPNLPFAFFRPRTSNFFEAVFNSLRHLFGA